MQQPINVMMISSSYPREEKDWKSVFVRQMLGALAEKPDVNMTYWGPPGEFPEGVTSACLPSESAWLDKLMEEGGLAHLLRNGGVRRLTAPLRFLVLLQRGCNRQKQVDLYHVNWLQNALPLWRRSQPALITVLGSDLGLLKIPGMTMLLRNVFKKRRCVLAPNADWMVDELKLRFGDVAQVIPIPLGINDEWFALHEKRKIVSPNKWLVVARLTHKKMGPLFEWGKDIFCPGSERELHLFGPMQEDVNIPQWVNYHGPTYPKALQDDWFPGASGLITTSQHDEGRPQVMLEAMAAGVPIIASDIPAHRNFITHQKTGWLVDSEKEFHSGIQWLSSLENNKAIAFAAREWVKKEVGTWSDCANRYLTVYRALLGDIK